MSDSSERNLERDIREGFEACEPLYSVGHAITVQASDGVVTLAGLVRTEVHKFLAEDIARSVNGVTAVINNITSDSTLATRVARQVGTNRELSRLLLRVDSVLGTINYNGPTVTPSQADRLTDLAQSVPFVLDVTFSNKANP